MKLLFDENLSARLVALLQAEYPGSADTMEGLITGLETKSAQNPTASP